MGENSPKIVTFSKKEPKIIHIEYFKILLKLIFSGLCSAIRGQFGKKNQNKLKCKMRDRCKKNAQSLSYTLVCFAVCLTALFVSRKIDVSKKMSPPKFTYDNGHWYQCVGFFELF